MAALKRAELFIALIGPVGVSISSLAKLLEEALSVYGYRAEIVHLADLLREFPKWEDIPSQPRDQYLNDFMTAGDDFRKIMKKNDAMSILGMAAVRDTLRPKPDKTKFNTAFIFRSLKLPEEIEVLKRVYGRGFISIAAYAPKDVRIKQLADEIARDHADNNPGKHIQTATKIVDRDESEKGDYGQNIGSAYHLADAFVDVTDQAVLVKSVNRIVDLIFSDPFTTPTKDEYGMFFAQAARRRSAALGRQVGAAVLTESGSIVAIGTNEVPKARGGQYWAGDSSDRREYTLGHDTNDISKTNVATEIVERLRKAKLLNPSLTGEKLQEFLTSAREGPLRELLTGTQLMSLTEFGREVHAEMSAILDASQRGVSVSGCTLFTTTFPCHNCARHLVMAGIRRVVYLEPYPKSLANHLHNDSIEIDSANNSDIKVRFESFVGVSYTRFMEFFEQGNRKIKDGTIRKPVKLTASPENFQQSISAYTEREGALVNDLLRLIDRRSKRLN